MIDLIGDGISRFVRPHVNLSESEILELSKTVSDDFLILSSRSVTVGMSSSDFVYDLVERFYNYSRFLSRESNKGKTLIFLVPSFALNRSFTKPTYHFNGYRDADRDSVHVFGEPIEDGSLSLVHEFKSSRNFVDNVETFYTLGSVYELTDKFRSLLEKYGSKDYRDSVAKIYVVTSNYQERNEVSALKSLHVLFRGIHKIAGVNTSVPLKRWIENFRRDGAAKYVSSLTERLSYERDSIMTNVQSLKNQMSEYFRQLSPIEFLLNDKENVIKQINDELIKCERVNGVESAYLDHDGTFHVFTKHIYIKQPTNNPNQESLPEEMRNLAWDLGKLHITVNKEGYTKIVSNTRQVQGYNELYVGHPHVIRNDNSVCLGEIETSVFELIQKHKYSTLAGLLVNFARSVNLSDSAGRNIAKWPVIQLKVS